MLKNDLRARRTDKGWTQAELAGRVGVSRKTINTVENNVFIPSTILALRLAGALEACVEHLFWLEVC
jgi:putative transcriptional regulator